MKTFVFAAAVAALLFSVSPVLAQVSPAQQFLAEIGCEKGLIMNGDDLGRSKWSNEGVLKAATEGALSSTSLMTAALGAQEAYEVIRNNPKLDVGVHLTLARDDAPGNLYSPLSPADKVPNLLNEQGFFITDLNTLFAK
nr:ChbG/HpnK family deacetylase [bacterium]